MEKIEFLSNIPFHANEKIKSTDIPHLPQCEDSKLTKFLNLFKRKKKIITWIDIEKEILEFLKECKIDSYWKIGPNDEIFLNVENTKKFIKRFNKYGRYYYASYDIRQCEECIIWIKNKRF